MKNIIVQKFGGTSVADISCIENVANLVSKEKDKGSNVVVVVSAMSGITDELIKKVNQVFCDDSESARKEYDVAIASGEQVSAALLALMLQKKGYNARSWLSWQIPIISDSNYNRAEIVSVNTDKIIESLKQDEIPVIAGFQGVYEDRITTIGRGGSDTTATAIAAALFAKRCDIYTDVSGVFTADPNVVKDAKKIDEISYEEMLELSSSGAKVLNAKSAEIAIKHNVPLRVLSSFNEGSGTVFIKDSSHKNKSITAITHSKNEAKITIELSNNSGVARALALLAQYDVKVDMIAQNFNKVKRNFALTFVIKKSELDQTLNILQSSKESLDYTNIEKEICLSKISIIGVGIQSNCTIVQQIFEVFAEENREMLLVSVSELKISILVNEAHDDLMLKKLHKKFNL
ncbi:MAG: aspartate kinase [Rickettsiales bacterium]|nr:aspartate kinase [Rickettsiales bacterium]